MNNHTEKNIRAIFSAIEKLVPVFDAQPRNSFTEGNVAICIIDENHQVFGRMFGTDRIRMRKVYDTAWTKASQVWITGMKTLEYERKVFNNEVDYKSFGILPPDFIGWRGGQPVVLKDGTRLSIGFSGFTGEADTEIVAAAIEDLGI